MSFTSGKPLKGPMELNLVLELMIELCNHDFSHGDVRINNIFWDGKNPKSLVVIDFGSSNRDNIKDVMQIGMIFFYLITGIEYQRDYLNEPKNIGKLFTEESFDLMCNIANSYIEDVNTLKGSFRYLLPLDFIDIEKKLKELNIKKMEPPKLEKQRIVHI